MCDGVVGGEGCTVVVGGGGGGREEGGGGAGVVWGSVLYMHS